MKPTLSATFRAIVVVALCAALGGCASLTAGWAAVTGDRRSTGTVFDDEQIESKAEDFFGADAELARSCHINIASFNRQALLTGECPTQKLRSKAADYAGRVGKVRNIFNEIAIAAPSTLTARSTDGLLTTKVRASLFTMKDLPSSKIKVVTEAAIVYLMGLVDVESGDRAARAAAGVAGVAKVVKLFEHP